VPNFLVESRDADYRRTGVIEQYISLDVIARFCDVGAFVITLPGNYFGSLLQPGSGIVVWVEGFAEPIMSGPITKIAQKWDASNPGAGLLTFSGESDERVLFARATYPQPAKSIYNQTADTAQGKESVGAAISGLVNLNAGPGARGNRQVPGLVVPGANIGRVVSWTSRFDVLGAKIRDLALANGVGWQLKQGDSGQIVFSVYAPRDLSSTAVFSREAGNLAAFNYSISAPQANRFLAAAQGEGKLRYVKPYIEDGAGLVVDPYEVAGTFVRPSNGWTSYWPERFIDRRDIAVAYNDSRQIIDPETGLPATADQLAALDGAIAEDALESASVAGLAISPIDSANLRFGEHYTLGDTVSVSINGEVITDVLREVRLTDDATSGPRVAPTVGSSNATETPTIYREIDRLWTALGKLEARQ
jgi:hypothetical protein